MTTVTSVERIAEVVLYEGYLLYPYTRSTLKNQQRWNFGGVYPKAASDASKGTDTWQMQTQCLVSGDPNTRVSVKLRYLQVVDRHVEDCENRVVERLRAGGLVHVPIDEAAERTLMVEGASGDTWLRVADLLNEPLRADIQVEGERAEETLHEADGSVVGTLIRTWRALHGTVDVSAEQVSDDLYRLTILVSNDTDVSPDALSTRQETLRQSFVSTHAILHVEDGAFVSLLEPPPEYADAATACENIGTWPVLVGEAGEQHTILSSPIILYDYPQIAPESHGDFFDATEIDELLTLSVLALTDDEKREMRETDLRAREILDRTEALSPEQVLKLHGAIRGLEKVQGRES